MAKQIESIGSLKENSIHIYSGMISVSPSEASESEINMANAINKFNNCYAVKRPTVCFISDGIAYATPYTDKLIRSLKAAGLKEKEFYVPFSEGDYPKNEATRWVILKKKAIQTYVEDFIEDCTTYSDKHGIRILSEETLKGCLEVPFMGIAIVGLNYETCYYPILNVGISKETIAKYIGTYDMYNNTVIFVYRNGKTYITKGGHITDELKKAGYTRQKTFVPLAHGEKIKDKELQKEWEAITMQ